MLPKHVKIVMLRLIFLNNFLRKFMLWAMTLMGRFKFKKGFFLLKIFLQGLIHLGKILLSV